VELYATKSYELTDVRFSVWIESWTGLRVAVAPALVAAKSCGSGDNPTKKMVSIDADSTVAVIFGVRSIRVICMVIYFLQG
jgi:hypothetical protein